MNIRIFLLVVLFLPHVAFAQGQSKPFNKGNFKIDVSYSSLMEKNLSRTYPDFCLSVNYGLTDWLVAGVFGSYGKLSYLLSGGRTSCIVSIPNPQPVKYDGEVAERYFHYGFNVELHPLSIWMPSFHLIDPYCRGELGLRTITKQYVPEIEDSYAERVHNSFLYGGSIGLAVNPSRYFGAFYELAYNNLNKEMIDFFANEIRMKPIQRFGLNIRFGGPKKWQR
ncbi:MAG: hypothetical protein IKQ79_06785 [Bacteroidales bacterium]|nr:hypothetical protein [Bacteroidales bacterium]